MGSVWRRFRERRLPEWGIAYVLGAVFVVAGTSYAGVAVGLSGLRLRFILAAGLPIVLLWLACRPLRRGETLGRLPAVVLVLGVTIAYFTMLGLRPPDAPLPPPLLSSDGRPFHGALVFPFSLGDSSAAKGLTAGKGNSTGQGNSTGKDLSAAKSVLAGKGKSTRRGYSNEEWRAFACSWWLASRLRRSWDLAWTWT